MNVLLSKWQPLLTCSFFSQQMDIWRPILGSYCWPSSGCGKICWRRWWSSKQDLTQFSWWTSFQCQGCSAKTWTEWWRWTRNSFLNYMHNRPSRLAQTESTFRYKKGKWHRLKHSYCIYKHIDSNTPIEDKRSSKSLVLGGNGASSVCHTGRIAF